MWYQYAVMTVASRPATPKRSRRREAWYARCATTSTRARNAAMTLGSDVDCCIMSSKLTCSSACSRSSFVDSHSAMPSLWSSQSSTPHSMAAHASIASLTSERRSFSSTPCRKCRAYSLSSLHSVSASLRVGVVYTSRRRFWTTRGYAATCASLGYAKPPSLRRSTRSGRSSPRQCACIFSTASRASAVSRWSRCRRRCFAAAAAAAAASASSSASITTSASMFSIPSRAQRSGDKKKGFTFWIIFPPQLRQITYWSRASRTRRLYPSAAVAARCTRLVARAAS